MLKLSEPYIVMLFLANRFGIFIDLSRPAGCSIYPNSYSKAAQELQIAVLSQIGAAIAFLKPTVHRFPEGSESHVWLSCYTLQQECLEKSMKFLKHSARS